MTETNASFLGRSYELTQLEYLLAKPTASLVVVTGRHRIGKSRLIMEFAKDKPFIQFTGIPPDDQVTAQDQRDYFARVLAKEYGLPGLHADDWADLFTVLANQTQKGRIVILLDELSWMGSKDPTFLGKLKTAWDQLFKNNPQVIMILCSSVSPWIEKNVLASTGFLGRIALKLTLHELALKSCSEMLDKSGFQGSHYEKFLVLALTGGVPWYLELINPAMTAVENIKQLCFVPDGILVDEFNQIFHDLFEKRGPICKCIVELLAEGAAEYSKISAALNYTSGGPLSDYMDSLEQSGFISRDYAWHFKTGKLSRFVKYRLADNYLRFYLKYISGNRKKIKAGRYLLDGISTLPAFATIMGLQFENLVLSNRALIHQCLGIESVDIEYDGPFFQRKTTSQSGCQIDYLLQTRLGGLYICEIKFSTHEIKSSVIKEVEQKINKLSIPKGLKCIPVLIHIGEVNQAIIERNYFFRIIDFSQFL